MWMYFRSGAHAFFRGLGSVLDLSGGVADIQRPESDAAALRGDWEAVGRDLEVATNRMGDIVEREQAQQLSRQLTLALDK